MQADHSCVAKKVVRQAAERTIEIVALQQRRHETSRDRIHEAEVPDYGGCEPVRLLATG